MRSHTALSRPSGPIQPKQSDNHTVGYFNAITGTGVPEPATWAMMIIGFGAAVRNRRRVDEAFAG